MSLTMAQQRLDLESAQADATIRAGMPSNEAKTQYDRVVSGAKAAVVRDRRRRDTYQNSSGALTPGHNNNTLKKKTS